MQCQIDDCCLHVLQEHVQVWFSPKSNLNKQEKLGEDCDGDPCPGCSITSHSAEGCQVTSPAVAATFSASAVLSAAVTLGAQGATCIFSSPQHTYAVFHGESPGWLQPSLGGLSRDPPVPRAIHSAP